MPVDHLFVYGTLRRGSKNRFARILTEQAEFLGVARIPGSLYDLGDYPGARPGDGLISGEVFRLKDASSTLAALDEYESSEFQRAIIGANGLDCWIYWYVGADPGRVIPSGDWFER